MRAGIPLAGVAALAIAVAGAVALRDVFSELSPAPPAAPATTTLPRADAVVGFVDPAHGDRDGAAGDGGEAAEARRPASLRGTRVDGGLVTDAAGSFVATPDARRLFDYFLAASGEESEADIVARVHAEIDRRLSPDAARDAKLLLDRYLAYRARARVLAEQGLAEAPLDERLATLRALRRETLGDETAAALFAEEDAVDAVAVAKLTADVDDAATPEERALRRDAAEEALPEAERENRRAARLALDLRAAEDALREGGASPDELRALRERTVGAEAAERLASLDLQRAQWQSRLDDYRDARAAIEGDASLDAGARAAAIERLRAERFDATERLRVEALDGIPSP